MKVQQDTVECAVCWCVFFWFVVFYVCLFVWLVGCLFLYLFVCLFVLKDTLTDGYGHYASVSLWLKLAQGGSRPQALGELDTGLEP